MGLSIPAKARLTVRVRDSNRCLRCGVRANNWHHRRSRAVRDDHTHCPCNGVTLCGSGTTGCHGWVHAHPFDAKAVGLIVSRTIAAPGLEPVRMPLHLPTMDVFLTCAGGYADEPLVD